MDEQTSLLRYYVYELLDPSQNDQVFYVGKGVGLRALHHGEEAKDEQIENEKVKRIRQIRDLGIEPKVLVVGRYETEAEALAVEATLIKWVYGKNNLTNVVEGHRHVNIRLKGLLDNIEGIDIERRPKYSFSGDYTADLRRQAEANQIVEKLIWARKLLIEQGYFVTEPDLSNSQDPCVYVEGFSDFAKIMFKIPPSGKTIVLNFIPINRSAKEAFMKKMLALNLELRKGGKNGVYSPLALGNVQKKGKRGIPIDEIEVALLFIKREIEKFQGSVN